MYQYFRATIHLLVFMPGCLWRGSRVTLITLIRFAGCARLSLTHVPADFVAVGMFVHLYLRRRVLGDETSSRRFRNASLLQRPAQADCSNSSAAICLPVCIAAECRQIGSLRGREACARMRLSVCADASLTCRGRVQTCRGGCNCVCESFVCAGDFLRVGTLLAFLT